MGSQIIVQYNECAGNVFISIIIMFSACMGASLSFANVPSVQIAKTSANSIFKIIDEESTLDVREAHKAKIQEVKEGQIEFKDVVFRYPSRPNQKVMNEMSFKIPAHCKIALVGSSGCGKSTITNLLLRFYEIESGSIEIDG